MNLRFRILGAIAAEVDGRSVPLGQPRQQAILGYLLVNGNALVTTDRLVTALWDTAAPATARNQVQTDVSIVRRMLRNAGAVDLIHTRATGYTLTLAPGQLDLDDFTARVHQARTQTDATTSVEILRSAIALWTGTALAGITAAYASSHRTRIHEQYLQAYEHLLDLELQMGRHTEVTVELIDLVGQHPVREPLVGRLMVALHRDGRHADALRVARELRVVLAEQYGLDPGRAIQDLEAAILRSDPSLDLPVASSPPTALTPADTTVEQLPAAAHGPRQLPRDLHGITPRHDLSDRLNAILSDRSGQRGIAVLAGAPGSGKTTLAVHWAHRHSAEFPDGQLYIDLRGFGPGSTSMSPISALRAALTTLGHQAASLPEDSDALASLYRTSMAGRRRLVLLDNARDAAQVRPLLPGDSQCAVIVTSRNQLTGLVATDGATTLQINAMTDTEALDLMTRRLGARRCRRESVAVADIIAYTGRLPLAMAIASALAAARPATPMDEIATDLRRTHAGIAVLHLDDDLTDMNAVFSWSYDQLSSDESALFRALGNHPMPEISLDAAASLAGLDRTTTYRHLVALIRASLITEHTHHHFTVHDLLHRYAREKADMPAAHVERGHAVRRLLGHYVHSALRAALLFQPGRRPLALGEPDTGVTITSITDRSQAIAWLDAERPALIAIATGAGGSDPDLDTYVWQLAWCISQYLYLQGHWGDWERIQTAALDAAVRLDDRHAIATSHRGLGQALTLLGRDREAETHLTTARRVAREIGEPAIEALALQTIADLYARQGRLQESLNRLNDALTIFQKTGSELGRAQALNNIAMRYMQLGRYIEALDTGAEALSIFQGSGELHGVSAVRDTLANIYCLQGEYDQAIDQFRRALRLNQDIGERYVESETLIRLGELYEITGEHDTAVAVVQQALEILEELGHPDQTEAREKLDKLVGIGV